MHNLCAHVQVQVYTLYCIAVVAWCILWVPNFRDLDLSVLTSLMNLVGTSLFLLQAFRVNSSYGEAPPPVVYIS